MEVLGCHLLLISFFVSDLPPPVMKETLDAMDDLGYFTLEMLRGDEELNFTHLVNEGKVNELIAHTLLLNLNRERESSLLVSLLPSPSPVKNGDRGPIARASIEIITNKHWRIPHSLQRKLERNQHCFEGRISSSSPCLISLGHSMGSISDSNSKC